MTKFVGVTIGSLCGSRLAASAVGALDAVAAAVAETSTLAEAAAVSEDDNSDWQETDSSSPTVNRKTAFFDFLY